PPSTAELECAARPRPNLRGWPQLNFSALRLRGSKRVAGMGGGALVSPRRVIKTFHPAIEPPMPARIIIFRPFITVEFEPIRAQCRIVVIGGSAHADLHFAPGLSFRCALINLVDCLLAFPRFNGADLGIAWIAHVHFSPYRFVSIPSARP